MPTDPTFADFRDHAAWGRYCGATYAIASCLRDGAFWNLAGRVMLQVQPPAGDWGLQGTLTNQLFVHRGWLSRQQVAELLQELPAGRIRLDDQEFRLLRSEENRPYTWTFLSQSAATKRLVGWPGRALVGLGDYQHDACGLDTFEALGLRLSRFEPRGFASWQNLGAFIGEPGVPLQIGPHTRAGFELCAPFYARIAEVRPVPERGTLHVEVECTYSPRPGELCLLTERQGAQQPIEREMAKGPNDTGDWIFLDERMEATAGLATVHLRLGNVTIDSQSAGAPPLPIRLHARLDPGDSWLPGLLERARKKTGAQQWNTYVVATLGLGGVATVPYGIVSAPDTPDLLAFFGEGRCLVGECKVTLPVEEEIDRLSSRVQALRETTGRDEPSLEVLGALFFPHQESELVRAFAERALARRIAMIGFGRMKAISRAIVNGARPGEIFQLLAGYQSALP